MFFVCLFGIGFFVGVFFFWNLPMRKVIVQLILICFINIFSFYRLQIKDHKDIYVLDIFMQWAWQWLWSWQIFYLINFAGSWADQTPYIISIWDCPWHWDLNWHEVLFVTHINLLLIHIRLTVGQRWRMWSRNEHLWVQSRARSALQESLHVSSSFLWCFFS